MATQLITDYLSTRLPVDLMEKIEKMASTERRSLSFMARLLIEEAVEAREKKSNEQ